jgi:hypothetical protein
MPKGSGKMVVLMLGGKGSCKPSDMEDDSDDMEEEDDDDMPMKKAKGGMVNKPKKAKVAKRKSIQIKGWGCARRGA